jgi:hypothetical protein
MQQLRAGKPAATLQDSLDRFGRQLFRVQGNGLLNTMPLMLLFN